MKSIIPTNYHILLAFAGILLSVLSSAASTVPNPASGDVFLAFRASGGTGSSVSYLVNLGQASQFTNATAGSSLTLSSIGNISLDLAAAYGSNWNTRSDLFWGIFGRTTTASPTVYGSRARTTVSTQSLAWPVLDLTARSTTASSITSVLTGIGGYRTSTATDNSSVATFQTNFSGAASYNYQVATAGTTDFGTLSQWSSIEGDFGGGAAGTALDLYRLSGSTTSPVSLIGTFKISESGSITFTAIPASNTDSDHDGFTDAQEAAAGTNPNDPTDYPHVQSVVHVATGNTVAFRSVLGRTYQIQYSETLQSGSWQVIGTYTESTSANLINYVDNDPVRRDKPQGFYRITVGQ